MGGILRREKEMQQVVPAIVGGVVLALAIFYLKVIKPKADKKKEDAAEELEATRTRLERKRHKDLLQVILPIVHTNGTIELMDIVGGMTKEMERRGETPSRNYPGEIMAAISYGSNLSPPYLIKKGSKISLAEKGIDEMKKRSA